MLTAHFFPRRSRILEKREICRIRNAWRKARLVEISFCPRDALGNIAQADVYWWKRISVSVRVRCKLRRRRNDKIMEADHDGWKHFSLGVSGIKWLPNRNFIRLKQPYNGFILKKNMVYFNAHLK